MLILMLMCVFAVIPTLFLLQCITPPFPSPAHYLLKFTLFYVCCLSSSLCAWSVFSPECSVRFDGSMSQAQRSQALQRFGSDPHARLLLISLKAGGVGLNLTAASYLFLLDPW
jgi:hypothetical protein